MGFQMTPKRVKAAEAELRERVADLDPDDVVGRVTALAEVMASHEETRAAIRKGVATAIFVMTNRNLDQSAPRQQKAMLASALSLDFGLPHPRAIPLLDVAGVISPRSDGGYWVAHEIEERIEREGDHALKLLGFLS